MKLTKKPARCQYNLTFDQDEAEVLLSVIIHAAGLPSGPRGIIDKFVRHFKDQGLNWMEIIKKFDIDGSVCINKKGETK